MIFLSPGSFYPRNCSAESWPNRWKNFGRIGGGGWRLPLLWPKTWDPFASRCIAITGATAEDVLTKCEAGLVERREAVKRKFLLNAERMARDGVPSLRLIRLKNVPSISIGTGNCVCSENSVKFPSNLSLLPSPQRKGGQESLGQKPLEPMAPGGGG